MSRKVLFSFLFIAALMVVGDAFKLQSRIVSGFEAKSAQFPFYAFLAIAHNESYVKTCGGSIINEFFILTAAHCVYENKQIFIYLGSTELDNSEEKSRIKIVVDPKDVILHPNFWKPGLYDDISLIRMQKPIKFSKTIQPVKLSSDFRLDANVNVNVLTIGNGYINETHAIAPVLQWAPMTTISLDLCRKYYPFIGPRKNIICAGSMLKRSISNGDSG